MKNQERNATFPRRLRGILDWHNITLAKFETMTGIKATQLQRYTSGKTKPDINNLVKITKVLMVSSDYLLGLTDDCGTETSWK